MLCSFSFFFSPIAFGSTEVDRQYQLESVGVLKSWDNIDGLFSEYVSTAYQNYFSNQSRFIMNDLSKADAVLTHSKLPYNKVINDPEILGQLARSTRTDSIIRTRIIKEGKKYFFTLDWLHSPNMELMATTSFTLEEPTNGTPFGSDTISEALEKNLAALISQVPIRGNVTGRDNNTVTINMGNDSAIHKGDLLLVGTLDEVKKHPLLKTIVGWHMTPTGKISVEQIDESMAFCKIVEESPGREISRYQKITQIITPPQPEEPDTEEKEPPTKGPIDTAPKYGWVSGTLLLGGFDRQFSSLSGPVNNSGGGFALGAKAQGQAWFTREWFADIQFGYGFWNYSQSNVSTKTQSAASAAGGVGGSVSSFLIDIGYSYLISGDFFGPKGWLKLGYKSTSYSLPVSTSENTGPISLGSFFAGIGGDMPIRGNWGVMANINFRLFTSVSQNWISDSVSGSSDIDFTVGGYYRLSPRLTLQGTIDVQASGADFTQGTSISQKTITFGPTLLYYF